MIKEVVLEAVKKAGVFALEKQSNFGEVVEKSTNDFFTEVDVGAEKIIIDHIRSKLPDAAFYGEESGRQGKGELLFVIDPIDGTTNYIHELPFFAICVAVYQKNVPILGVISCPALGTLYVAAKGEGAFCNGQKITVSSVSDLGQAVVGYNKSQHKEGIKKRCKEVISRVIDSAATFRALGTGVIEYCYTASGSLDVCISPKAEPFHSAGYIIMEEAGAKVTDWDGNPHQLDSKTLISANPVLYEQVLELVRGLDKD